jgi:hypothetical protein
VERTRSRWHDNIPTEMDHRETGYEYSSCTKLAQDGGQCWASAVSQLSNCEGIRIKGEFLENQAPIDCSENGLWLKN